MKPVSILLMAGTVGALLSSSLTAGAATEKVIYSFCQSCTDGGLPDANLIDVGGILYGTTPVGGNQQNSACTDQVNTGCGTAYGIDPASGKETMLYAFCSEDNCADGDIPSGSLVNVGRKLFGMTGFGGANDAGTIFSIDPATGAEKVRYSFCSQCVDASGPEGGLVDVKGTLYGATFAGDASGVGVLFSFDPKTGTETDLYGFNGYGGDGARPNGDLHDVAGVLYGTTLRGGANDGGTVFSFNLATGVETVLYAFGTSSGPDGSQPIGGLIDVKGSLYGSTYSGGAHGKGAVFAINLTNGKEKVLYSFCAKKPKCMDGREPVAGLLKLNGMLYGSTSRGGPATGPLCKGCGVIFSLDPKTGAESVVYPFCSQAENCPDGFRPESGLINVNGLLYGTTSFGGARDGGTVFSLQP